MQLSEPSPRYTSVAIALHWLLALALGAMIAIGKNMYDADHQPISWLFQLHKSIGITILVLVIARIVWRFMNPPPALPEAMASMEKRAAHGVHVGLYALMILLPLTGWIMVSVSPFAIATVLYGAVSWPHLPAFAGLALETRELVYPRIENVHELLSWALIALFVLHLAGAIKHELSDEEGVIKRMIPGLFGKTAPPQAPSRGALTAFGSAALFFGVIAATPVIAQSLGNTPAAEPATSGVVANWQIDQEASEIAFSGDYNGNPYSGTFAEWTADISFDPENLADSRAAVSVDVTSIDAGVALYNDTLKATEWFDMGTFPSITIDFSEFEASEDGFSAIGNMAIKGATVEVPLSFSLTIDGDDAVMTGQTTLSRSALDLGQDSDPGGDWVADDVLVDVTVTASRTDN